VAATEAVVNAINQQHIDLRKITNHTVGSGKFGEIGAFAFLLRCAYLHQSSAASAINRACCAQHCTAVYCIETTSTFSCHPI
jgi:hypothetical protein